MTNTEIADLLEELAGMKEFEGYDCGGVFCECGIDCRNQYEIGTHKDTCPVPRAIAAAKELRELSQVAPHPTRRTATSGGS